MGQEPMAEQQLGIEQALVECLAGDVGQQRQWQQGLALGGIGGQAAALSAAVHQDPGGGGEPVGERRRAARPPGLQQQVGRAAAGAQLRAGRIGGHEGRPAANGAPRPGGGRGRRQREQEVGQRSGCRHGYFTRSLHGPGLRPPDPMASMAETERGEQGR